MTHKREREILMTLAPRRFGHTCLEWDVHVHSSPPLCHKQQVTKSQVLAKNSVILVGCVRYSLKIWRRAFGVGIQQQSRQESKNIYEQINSHMVVSQLMKMN